MSYSSSMVDIHTLVQRNSRRIIGGVILFISLISALGLAAQANNKVSMWAAKSSIHSGTALTTQNLVRVKVSLGAQSGKYFSDKAELTGSYPTRNIDQGELIPVSAIVKVWASTRLKEISIGVAKNDFPLGLRIGDLVDLYSIPSRDSQAITSLIVSRTAVTALDVPSQSMGGVIGIDFRVEPKNLAEITSAIQMGRILVVKDAL